MKTLKAKKLKNEMTIGLLSVSGAIEDYNELEIAKSRLEKSGFEVVISPYKNYRDMAGTKKDCINTLHDFFENPKIDAIIASRGGYGTLRFLREIDYKIIKKNPKIFVGFSDITNLLAMFYKKAGLIGFYGPMALSELIRIIGKAVRSDRLHIHCADYKIYHRAYGAHDHLHTVVIRLFLSLFDDGRQGQDIAGGVRQKRDIQRSQSIAVQINDPHIYGDQEIRDGHAQKQLDEDQYHAQRYNAALSYRILHGAQRREPDDRQCYPKNVSGCCHTVRPFILMVTIIVAYLCSICNIR